MSVKFVLENVEILRKYHVLEGIVLLVHVILAQKLRHVKKQNISIMQMWLKRIMNIL